MTAPAPRRILLVTPGFPADERDSLCIPPLQLMLRELKGRRPDLALSVLALHYPAEIRSYRWHGIEVRALGRANHRWPLRLIDLARARRLAERLHAGQPFSHVHAFWLSDAALVASSIANSWSCSASVTAMGQDVLPANRYSRRLTRGAAQLVAISDRAAVILEQSAGRKPDRVIPWGIGPPPDVLPQWDSRPIDVLGVGSLIDLKRWSHLLEVCGRLAASDTNHRTVLVGDGPLRASLEAEARERGLSDALVFTGELPRSEVLRLMEKARVLLHPSRFEGQGFVFDEALSRGMSIVSGPVGTATPSERWRVTTSEALASECSDLLRHSRPTTGLTLHPLEDTVTAYAELWGVEQ
ncbi:MAG: glycosyltransferase [Acidobacteria bacterium]|nr:glycosyltransferase [Acidobacteriota bacterium]